MKEFVPYHAENHVLAPGPGRASKLLTSICFIESEGGQVLFINFFAPLTAKILKFYWENIGPQAKSFYCGYAAL
jgi:hypothetical protein